MTAKPAWVLLHNGQITWDEILSYAVGMAFAVGLAYLISWALGKVQQKAPGSMEQRLSRRSRDVPPRQPQSPVESPKQQSPESPRPRERRKT